MSLLGLLEKDFSLPTEILTNIQTIGKRTREDFCYKNEYVIENTSAHCLREIHLLNEIATSENKISLGFDDLEKQLTHCQPEDSVSMRLIESPNWGGHIYYLKEGMLLGIF